MNKRKTAISGASSYHEISEFWDEHDLSDYWDQTHEIEMVVEIELSAEAPSRSKDVVKFRHDRSR
jgi:hypothetical protein